MKKSVLALTVAAIAFAGAANAKTVVYDKDGTQFYVDGRVYANFDNKSAAGNKDSSIFNSSRFGVGGKTKLTDGVYGIGYTQWDMSDSTGADQNNTTKVRDQYVGVDFGDFGVVKMGRFKTQLVRVGEIVDDIIERNGCLAIADERRSGQLSYNWLGYGVELGLAAQTAVNNATVDFLPDGKANIDVGGSGFVAYTTPSVLFGPIRIAAGYEHLKFQDDNNGYKGDYDKQSTWSASLLWGAGDKKPGFTVGAVYTGTKTDAFNKDNDIKTNAAAGMISYTFDSGVTLATEYQFVESKQDDGSYANMQRVPVQVFWTINPNFKVFAVASFAVDENKLHDDDGKALTDGYVRNLDVSGDNLYRIGAMYTF
ncbi:MAG: porin [Succinivibrio sp.]|nr:porin [Succinivibrio sp.]